MTEKRPTQAPGTHLANNANITQRRPKSSQHRVGWAAGVAVLLSRRKVVCRIPRARGQWCFCSLTQVQKPHFRVHVITYFDRCLLRPWKRWSHNRRTQNQPEIAVFVQHCGWLLGTGNRPHNLWLRHTCSHPPCRGLMGAALSGHSQVHVPSTMTDVQRCWTSSGLCP